MLLIVIDDETRSAVEGPGLRPRRIAGGPRAGAWALGPQVLSDPAHALAAALLAAAPLEDLDPALAWPPAD